MNTLNEDPLSYSDGIRFTTAAAWDYGWGLLLSGFHHGNALSDPIVTVSSVHSIYAWNQTIFLNMLHNNLVDDESGRRRTYDHVEEWLNYGIDSDGDGVVTVLLHVPDQDVPSCAVRTLPSFFIHLLSTGFLGLGLDTASLPQSLITE